VLLLNNTLPVILAGAMVMNCFHMNEVKLNTIL